MSELFSNIVTRIVLSWVHTSKPSMEDAMKAAAMGKTCPPPSSVPMNRHLVRCIKGRGQLPVHRQAKNLLNEISRSNREHCDLFSLANNNQGDFLVDAPADCYSAAVVQEFLKRLDALCVGQET